MLLTTQVDMTQAEVAKQRHEVTVPEATINTCSYNNSQLTVILDCYVFGCRYGE